jgi:hypothetical protein
LLVKPGGNLLIWPTAQESRTQLGHITFSATACLAATMSFAQALTPGDVLVYQVGNGSTALSSAAAPVFLDEYSTSGVLVEQIAVPTTSVSGGNQTLTESGSASSDGLLTDSPAGQYVTFTGYDAPVGTAGVVGCSGNRTGGIMGVNGLINTTTTANIDSGDNIRSAVTSNGTSLYTAGASGGVYSLTIGSSSATLINGTSARQVTIFDGQLYFDSSSTIYSLGSVSRRRQRRQRSIRRRCGRARAPARRVAAAPVRPGDPGRVSRPRPSQIVVDRRFVHDTRGSDGQVFRAQEAGPWVELLLNGRHAGSD